MVHPHPWFQLLMVNVGPKILMENSRDKQFISFKLHAVLISRMKSCALWLHLSGTPNHQQNLFLTSKHCHSWMIQAHPKQTILLCKNPQNVNSSLMLCHSPHFISSCVSLSHIITRRVIQHKKKFLRERSHSRNFYCSILL